MNDMTQYITIGVAGHVDHGKTTLVRCLTGVDTDRMKEEQRRGMSMESGIASWLSENGISLALVDVPGHTDFLRNTVRGLSGVDLALLIVAADDGVMPQTVEHLEILKFFSAKGGLVVLTKSDLVDDETLELAELEIRELIHGSFLEGKEVVAFSAMDLSGSAQIRDSIMKEACRMACRSHLRPFRLWIDRITGISGFGTVVSGTVLSGTLNRDEQVEIMPSGLKTRARFLESHGVRVDHAAAGQRIGINLNKTTLTDVCRGMSLRQPGTGVVSSLANADVRVLASAGTPLNNRMRVKLYIGTLCVNAVAVVMKQQGIHPGNRAFVQFRFSEPVSIDPRDRFVVALMNRNRIIGGGVILEIPVEKYTENRAGRILPVLDALQSDDAEGFVDAVLVQSVNAPVFAQDLAARSGFSLERIREAFNRKQADRTVMKTGDGGVYLSDYVPELVERVYHAARRTVEQGSLKSQVNSNEIRDALDRPVSMDLIQEAVRALCGKGRLIRSQGGYTVPGFSITLTDDEERLKARLLGYAEQSGSVPFSVSRFCRETEGPWNEDKVRRMSYFLHSLNLLVKLNNNRFISVRTMERIKTRVKGHILNHGSVCLADCQEITGNSRSTSVPVFEYLDSVGFTVRNGDLRILAEVCHT